ncbi:MAG: hypothetical protein QNJ45_05445 [Ardenticatenaceae bacterium]|nr:hypothetical protein [Ardenticatenaceae bacterium]
MSKVNFAGRLLTLAVPIAALISVAYAAFLPGMPLLDHELTRIVCYAPLQESYSAKVLATGLSGPDGLAFDKYGLLHVAEEGAGRVVQIDASGTITTLLSGLNQPEGIAFDENDALYVVEDVVNGRLIRRDPGGVTTNLATNLTYPEGVAVGPDGTIYVTQSDLETLDSSSSPTDFQNARSSITAFAPDPPFTPTLLIESSPEITSLSFDRVEGKFWSYADLAIDGQTLYVTNELAGVEIITTTTQPGFPVTVVFSTTQGILTTDLTNPVSLITWSESVILPEGIDFDEQLLAVAEEDTSGVLQLQTGRLSLFSAAGAQLQKYCDGFESIEDVAAQTGHQPGFADYFISEDSTGQIIQVQVESTPLGDCGALSCNYLPLVIR